MYFANNTRVVYDNPCIIRQYIYSKTAEDHLLFSNFVVIFRAPIYSYTVLLSEYHHCDLEHYLHLTVTDQTGDNPPSINGVMYGSLVIVSYNGIVAECTPPGILDPTTQAYQDLTNLLSIQVSGFFVCVK